MAKGITCTCGHSWNKSDSSKKDMYVCHICGKDNTMKDGGWLDKYQPGGKVAKADATAKPKPGPVFLGNPYAKEMAKRQTYLNPQGKSAAPAMKQAALDRAKSEKTTDLNKKIANYAQNIGGALELAAPFTGPAMPILGAIGTGLDVGASTYLAGKDISEGNYGSAAMNAGFGALGAVGLVPMIRYNRGLNAAVNTVDDVSDIAGLYNSYDNLGREYAGKVRSSKSEIDWGKDYWEKLYSKENELQNLGLDMDQHFDKLREYEKSLLADLGVGKNLGGGSYGQVYESATNPSTAIKLGRPMSYGSLDAINWTPEFIESANSINKYGNIAVPKNVQYFESPNTWRGTHEYMEMPNLNQSFGQRLDLNKRDRYALFLKQARQLRDKGIKLDVANPLNFSYNKEKNIFDIYDINPGNIRNPGYYMQNVINKTKGPLLNNMLYKNGGWLDKYNDGGPVQPNYNDASTSFPPNFVGQGYDTTGRNYSPAWGGQFAMGGSMPGAVGFTYARTKGIPSNGPYAKKTMASAQDGKTIYSGMLPEITVVGSKDPQTEEYYRTMLDRLTKEQGLEEGVLQSDPIYNNAAEVDEVFSNPISTNKILGRYEGLMDLGKKYGFPKVHPIDKNSLLSKIAMNIGGDKKSPANYDPFSKTIQANNTKQWVSEMAHHAQMKDNKLNKGIQLMRNDLPALVVSEIMLGNRRGPYYTPGAVEYEAHSIIEPKLKEEIKKSESEYKQLPYIQKLKDQFYGPIENYQNGGEMRYYQEGLDFQPKTISRNGSVIKDDMGQWAHPGEITEIGSNQITMQGVPYPVLGISDTGDTQMMYPNQEYQYDGSSVTEYPMMKEGGALQLTKLDQLTNFTNYNTKQPGGWLDKYQD